MRRNGPPALALPVSVVWPRLWVVVACGAGRSASSATPAAPSLAPPSAASRRSRPTRGREHDRGQPRRATDAGARRLRPRRRQRRSDQRAATAGSLSAKAATRSQACSGTYCWNADRRRRCVDSPRSRPRAGPARGLTAHAAADAADVLRSADGYPFASWSANYVDDNGNVVPLGGPASSFDPDASTCVERAHRDGHFPAPPAGTVDRPGLRPLRRRRRRVIRLERDRAIATLELNQRGRRPRAPASPSFNGLPALTPGRPQRAAAPVGRAEEAGLRLLAQHLAQDLLHRQDVGTRVPDSK